MPTIDFRYWEDCPSHVQALARLRAVLADEGVEAPIRIRRVDTDSQARVLRFVGSPTILVDGADIDPPPAETPARLACRVYRAEDGRMSALPSVARIRESIRAARAFAKE